MRYYKYVVLAFCFFGGISVGLAQSTEKTETVELQCFVNNEPYEQDIVIPANSEIIIKVVNTDSSIVVGRSDSIKGHLALIKRYAASLSSYADLGKLQMDSVQSYHEEIEKQIDLIKSKGETVTYQIIGVRLKISYNSTTKTSRPKWQPKAKNSKTCRSPAMVINLPSYNKKGMTIDEVRIRVKRVYQYDVNNKADKMENLKKTFDFVVKIE